MDLHRRTWLRLAASAGGAAAFLGPTFAQPVQPAYPSQPVKLIVPFTAGSTTDIVGRIISERLQVYLGQPCVIDNRPGAGGTLGAAAVVNAAADGHTVLIHSSGHVANAALYPGLKYDPQNDLLPLTMLASMPNVLVVAPSRGFASLQDLVRKVKDGKQRYLYGSSGNGSASHIAGEKFRMAAGIEAAHVPYRGTPQALTDVMGGRIDWFMAPLALAVPLVQGGKLTALSIGAPMRSALLPQVPTTSEIGLVDADDMFWVGMFVAARTPQSAAVRLHAETVRVLKTDEVRSRLERIGADAMPMSQQAFARRVREETVATTTLIRRAGIRLDT